jgi:nucleoside phosphorylase
MRGDCWRAKPAYIDAHFTACGITFEATHSYRAGEVMASIPEVDIGILTIRDDEFRAVLDAFPDDHSIHRSRHREYTFRSADAGRGRFYRLALLRQIEQGNGEAQEAARDLIDDLQPSLLLVVGIAGGLPSDDISLGDVVLSTRILDFSLEARKFKDATAYSVGGGPIAKAIAAGVANLSGREAELGQWWTDLPPKPSVSFSKKQNLYGPLKWQRELGQKLKLHYGPNSTIRPPIFYAGTIASSDRLVKDPKVLFPLISAARNIQAIEMESAGVHRATRANTPMLTIRGISDIVGLKRNDAWTKYACASAAAFARAYLRTRPVEIRSRSDRSTDAQTSASVKGGAAQPEKSTPSEEAYANLLRMTAFPERLFVAPATCASIKDGWRVLLGNNKGKAGYYVPSSWFLYEGNVYSLADPEESVIGKIVDTGGVEVHQTKNWAFSQQQEQRRQFVSLMNNALRDDLWCHGVRFHPDAEVYAFVGSLDKPPRKFKYQNLRVRSTVTVVSHYEGTTKAGKSYKYLRHVAFKGRFRLLEDLWYLEITPTYRFTTDGKKQHWRHEDLLSGIKRFEKNRSVLSQILLWQAVLRAPWTKSDRQRMLEFGALPRFDYRPTIDERELTALDAPAIQPALDKEVDE